MSELSYLEKLLDGVEVEWLPLGEITKYEQPTKYLVKAKDYHDTYTIPVLTAGKTFILGYTNETHGIYQASKAPVIIFDDFTTANKWVDFDFKAKSSAMKMVTSCDDNKTLLKYVYYWLNTLPSEFAEGDHKRQWISNYSQKKIPIPCPDNPEKSLAIQSEIVRILDKFSELTAELNMRKKQYNYYRDQLLRFKEGEVEWKTLGEIGEFIRGKRFTKADYVEDGGISVIHYGEIYTRYGVYTTHSLSQVRADMAASLRYAKHGDVVITDVGETVEDVGKAVAWLGDDDIAIHDHCYAFRHSLNPKFISYYMQTDSFISEKAKYVARTKVNTLLINGFSKIMIPVPYPKDHEKSLKEQARIVAILDKFDTLINSITEGLPREIELRQKQYEYYRDLLFSFPKPETVSN
ncbi:TPA: restriction endonuclease subunit S [Escherichia coli]|uniref:restriction endonuclease subunit S n=1 Tax=Escherichia coli TaxID=562 RepID=UPI000DDE6C04|nr:restriction endonuclease subunit S [Escherichia coli]EEZ7624532.1 restriction endonuclease subunit S [Escherichia coli]EJU9655776.1 restriction endonuclease subunit S [Escherichia coli]EKX4966016.1 restriction endonuclease subunit S [Escherichia coli]MCV5522315.1 restriction endonuclease subunit S [Escherichia coli]MDC8868070.1 restriction endonuclease subunit S [Escherichia coli]